MEEKLNFDLPSDAERICFLCENMKRKYLLPAFSSNTNLNDPLSQLSILAENMNQFLFLKGSHVFSITHHHNLPLHKAMHADLKYGITEHLG